MPHDNELHEDGKVCGNCRSEVEHRRRLAMSHRRQSDFHLACWVSALGLVFAGILFWLG